MTDFLKQLNPLLGSSSACIFDFDGTLADTEGFHYETYRKLLREQYGFEIDWPHWLHYIGRTDPAFHRMMEADFGVQIDSPSLMEVYFRTLCAEQPAAVAPYSWVRPLLSELSSRGIVPCVLSSGNLGVIRTCLAFWDLDGFFDPRNVISVSAGDFTKADVFAEPARYIAGFSGRPSDLLLFEDSIHTIQTARSLGVCRVAGIAHAYNRGIEAWCEALI